MNFRSRIGAIAAALLIAGSVFYIVNPLAGHKDKKADAPVPVVLDRAANGEVPIEIMAIGTVRPHNMVTVRPRVDGAVTTLAFQEGQLVRAGQVIARIDPRPYMAALRQAEAQEARDRAIMANLSVDEDRAAKLAQIGAGPDQTAKTLSAQLRAARATVAADAAAVEAARLNLSFTTITAPTSGRIGQRLIGVGSVVSSSDTTGIATIAQIDPIDVQFVISQDRLDAAVKAKNAATPVEILTRDGGDRLAMARLDFLDNEVQTGTGQIAAKAQVDKGGDALWPGQLVSVRVALGKASGVTVPNAAIQGAGEDSYVYVVKDGRADIRPIVITFAGGRRTVIASGLKAGELIVVDGQSRLKASARVKGVTAQTNGEAGR